MTQNEMAAELVAELERPLEIDWGSRRPAAKGGAIKRFRRGIDRKPAWSLVDDGEATAIAGDRGTVGDRLGVVSGFENDPGRAARHQAADAAKVGNNACEHGTGTRYQKSDGVVPVPRQAHVDDL